MPSATECWLKAKSLSARVLVILGPLLLGMKALVNGFVVGSDGLQG